MNTKDCRRADAEVTDRLRNSVGKIESRLVGNDTRVFVCVAKLGRKSRPVGPSPGPWWQVIVFVCCVTPPAVMALVARLTAPLVKRSTIVRSLAGLELGREDKKI